MVLNKGVSLLQEVVSRGKESEHDNSSKNSLIPIYYRANLKKKFP